MAYDNKNKYPKDAKPAKIEPVSTEYASSKIDTGDEIVDRALKMLAKWNDGMNTLQDKRKIYKQYYNIDKLGNEVDGRSQVVMSDVSDIIESLMPALMKIFYGGKDAVEIMERRPGQEMKAKLMAEKINYDMQKTNNGFKIIYNFFKDSLVYKMGVIKYYWKKGNKMKPRSVSGISHEQYTALLQNTNKYKIDKVSSNVGSIDGTITKVSGMPKDTTNMITHTMDVEYQEITKYSQPVLENIPPEEFIFDIESRELKECFHKKAIHKNALRKYGMSKEEIESAVADVRDNWDLYNERFSDIGGAHFMLKDKKGEYVFIYEGYINEYDEDGNEKPVIMRLFGKKLLGKVENNPYGRPPFVCGSPFLEPHRLIGKGLAELLIEVQKLRTALVRYILDSIYFSTNGMNVINPYRIDLQSLIDGNRPGGIVLTKMDIDPNSAILPIRTNPVNADTLKMLEYVEGPMRENRTGITRYNQGSDASSLNKTASGISQIMNASQARIELIARVFAETAMKDLYTAMVEMNIDFYDIETNIKINEQWQSITREQLNGDFEVMIDIGSSTGSKEMNYQQKIQMLNTYMSIGKMIGPEMSKIAGIPELKNMLQEMWEDLGIRNTDKFVLPDSPNDQIPLQQVAQQMAQQMAPQMAQQMVSQQQMVHNEAQKMASQMISQMPKGGNGAGSNPVGGGSDQFTTQPPVGQVLQGV